MNTEEETASVTLMILAEDLEPIEISSQFQLEPSQAWRHGEEKQRAVGTYYDWGGWKLISENKDLAHEDQISEWVHKPEGKEKRFESLDDRRRKNLWIGIR